MEGEGEGEVREVEGWAMGREVGKEEDGQKINGMGKTKRQK